MEKPSTGRATIIDTLRGLEISIPAKRNGFIVVFLGFWLCGWAMGEIFAIGGVSGLFGEERGPGLFLLFWLGGWTVGGFFAIRTFFWNLRGREVITVESGLLTVDMKGALFVKTKTYDLNEAKCFRVQEDEASAWGNRRNNSLAINNGGTIRFDYGMQTVKFAGGIDEAEAKMLLRQLKNKNLLTDKNFSAN